MRDYDRARGERLRLIREAIELECKLDSLHSESDFDSQYAEELNNRIMELSVQIDRLRREETR